jgi:hypothetical protein
MKEDLMLEEVYEKYDDEIDLVDLIKTLYRGRYIIFITVLIFIVLGVGYGFILKKNNYTVKTSITLSFDGAEEGFVPNGARFDEGYIKNDIIIGNLYDKFSNLKEMGISKNDLFNSIVISPEIPLEIKKNMENNPTYSYYPTNFTISINLTNDKNLDKIILNNFVLAQKEYFENKFSEKFRLNLIDSDFKNYDYDEAIILLEGYFFKIDKLYNTLLDSLNQNSFLSIKDFFEFNNEIDNIKNTKFNSFKSIVKEKKITKNSDLLLLKYKENLNTLNMKIESLEAEKKTLENILDRYKPEQSSIYMNGTEFKSAESGNIYSYYSDLINQAASKGMEAARLRIELEELKNNIDKIKNINNNNDFDMINSMLSDIVFELNKSIRKFNEFEEEYNTFYFSNSIVQNVPAIILNDGLNILLISLLSLILGLFIGTFVVFIREFIKNIDWKN